MFTINIIPVSEFHWGLGVLKELTVGCEILTSAMCCEDTCGFSLRGRLKARERKAGSTLAPALLGLGVVEWLSHG